MMERITSRQNAIVKRFRELARASGTTTPGEVLLDGAHLVQEALACGVAVEVAAFSDRQVGAAQSPLARIAKDVKKHGGRVLSVSDHVLAAMSPVQHPSGVVAIGHTHPSDLRAAFAVAPQLVLVLAGLQDPGNVGAIVRTAAAFGATGLVTIEGSANPFGWKALRGGMGGTFRVPVAARGTWTDVVAAAANARVRVIAAVPHGGTPLARIDLREPTAIILGGEGAGISEMARAAAAGTVTIPMRPPVESLNVAIAAALMLYEASRQREKAD
jgi:RNA methyltransferase, TrmH family